MCVCVCVRDRGNTRPELLACSAPEAACCVTERRCVHLRGLSFLRLHICLLETDGGGGGGVAQPLPVGSATPGAADSDHPATFSDAKTTAKIKKDVGKLGGVDDDHTLSRFRSLLGGVEPAAFLFLSFS